MATLVSKPRAPMGFTALPLAVDIWTDDERLFARLVDGREISVPIAWFPRLLAATSEQRAQWSLIGNGEGIHWEELDEDISIASLLGLPSD